MTSFFLAFVYPIPSLGPNNHGFQRICFAGTMTGFVFFSLQIWRAWRFPFFSHEMVHLSASEILLIWETSLTNSSRRGNIL